MSYDYKESVSFENSTNFLTNNVFAILKKIVWVDDLSRGKMNFGNRKSVSFH